MRTTIAIVAAISLVSGLAGAFETTSRQGGLQVAQATTCQSKCESAKTSCMEQHTTTNNLGVKMVTKEGAKLCWAAYRECVKSCR